MAGKTLASTGPAAFFWEQDITHGFELAHRERLR